MFIVDILAAATQAAPQNKFGFAEALEQGGFIAYATVVILGIMSFGSFFILFTKWFEQSKLLRQYRELRASFWRAPTLKDGAAKLEKNSAWRQIVDDGLAAEDAHAKMTDALEAHDWLHGSLARSEASVNARLASGLPFLATVGATSPFIGLFGTVVGMIEIFGSQAPSGSNPIQLAHGISVALYNTGFGLLIAIPSMIFWRHFRALVDSFVIEMQQQAVRLVEVLHGQRKS